MKVLKEFTKQNGEKYATVVYDEGLGAISDVWEGYFGTSENFETVLRYLAEQIEEKKIKKWLADLREMQGPFQNSSEFIAKEITPRVFKAGLEKEAVVLPTNIFSQISAETTKKNIPDEKVRMFDDMQEAKNWLQS